MSMIKNTLDMTNSILNAVELYGGECENIAIELKMKPLEGEKSLK